ncbi:DUF2922 domain-containing protein [Bacillus salitolerans]|uniref:DUF2922 domain-containing protein n=1 Tax=Bacillus salitolerans TaxID=1437434 RepID=A0ABW4LTK4_9BACI
MAKVLQLQFLNQEDKTVTLTIEDPIEPVDPAAVNAAMDVIIASNVFISSGGEYTSKKGARVVERNIEEVIL